MGGEGVGGEGMGGEREDSGWMGADNGVLEVAMYSKRIPTIAQTSLHKLVCVCT